jgi:hypothetical protein
VALRRQELPWVRLDKEYPFETDEGSASLADLLRGRSQLFVYHFMFGPDYKAGTYSRGLDGPWGMYQWLTAHPRDVTGLGSGAAGTTSTRAERGFTSFSCWTLGGIVSWHVGRDDGADDAAVALPVLWRYRLAVGSTRRTRLVWPTTLVALGYLFSSGS